MEVIERLGSSNLSDEVLEELDSLRAIYDSKVIINAVSDNVFKIILMSSEEAIVNIYINEDYPNVLPTIKSNFKIVKKLEQIAEESIGTSMLYTLLSNATDILNEQDSTKENPQFSQQKATKNKEIKEDQASTKKKQPKQKSKKKDHLEEYTKKKKPMRTAIDVINRILWDESLQTDNFIVGYLDRFLGVQEKLFSAFSWEDIASVDYTVLAIPKHRIQYFKYKNVKIWDKNERFDKVFGSTGHTETLEDIVGRDTEDNFATNSVCQSSNMENEIKTKRYDDKDRPNFFLCLPVSNEQIKLNIKKVQDQIVSCDDRLKPGLIQLPCAHVTLCMMRLDNKKDEENAANVLKKLEEILVCMLPLNNALLTVKKVDNFRGLVVYAVVESNNVFHKFVDIAKAKLKDAGIRLVGNYDTYTPHSTIMKLNRPMCKELNMDCINPFLYESVENIYFGQQPVNHLRICSTSKERGDDNFYLTISSLSNNLLCISDELPSLISSYVKSLMDAGLILEDIGDDYIASLYSNDKQKFENTVIELERNFAMLNNIQSKTVLILRGLPGSGKSFFMEHLLSTADESLTYAVCSADKYFQSKTSYEFSGEEIANAHRYCRKNLIKSLKDQLDLIIIDNTHSQMWEYQIYQRIAKLCGYKYHVIEMQCENDIQQQIFQKRCLHKVSKYVHEDMFSRWEIDTNAVCVNSDSAITVSNILNSELESDIVSRHVLYSALYLDESSKTLLLQSFPPSHGIVTADHMTITHSPSPKQIEKLPIGKSCNIKVTGVFDNYCMQVVAVEELNEKLCTMELSHVTISHTEEAAPKCAQQWLKESLILKPCTEIILSGVIGFQIATSKTTSQMCVDSKYSSRKKTGTNFKPDDEEKNIKLENQNVDEDEEAGMYFGPEVVKSLLIFDFDATLFHTPDPAEGRRDYERIMGVRWPNNGWLSQEGSLQYPLLVYPGPTLKDYFDYHNRACSTSILLTGRMERVRNAVEAIASENHMIFERRMLKPEDDRRNGRRREYGGVSTYTYKKDYVASLLKEYKYIEELIFWDDRPDNIKKIRALANEFPLVNFNVINVQEKVPNLYQFTPEEMLDRMGKRPSQSYKAAVSEGIEYITKAWMSVLGTDIDQSSNIIPFGSYVLKRRTDVDLCILAPKGKSINSYIEALGDTLKSFGVRYINIASGIRCPRLKIKFIYLKASPVEFDVVIATVLDDLNSCNVDIKSIYNSSDASSKTVLDGLVFIEDIILPVEAKISLEDFGMMVDMVYIILSKNNLKGNAFHCIRTFHIVNMLAKFIDECPTDKLPMEGFSNMKLFEKCFLQLLRFLSKVTYEEWQDLFKNFVPDIYIEPLSDFFKHSCKSNSNIANLLFTAPKSKKHNHEIQLQLICEDSVELWKAMTITEARLGTCIRELIERGFKVYPGSILGNIISFTMSNVEGSKKILRNFVDSLQKGFPDNVKVQIKNDNWHDT